MEREEALQNGRLLTITGLLKDIIAIYMGHTVTAFFKIVRFEVGDIAAISCVTQVRAVHGLQLGPAVFNMAECK